MSQEIVVTDEDKLKKHVKADIHAPEYSEYKATCVTVYGNNVEIQIEKDDDHFGFITISKDFLQQFLK